MLNKKVPIYLKKEEWKIIKDELDKECNSECLYNVKVLKNSVRTLSLVGNDICKRLVRKMLIELRK